MSATAEKHGTGVLVRLSIALFLAYMAVALPLSVIPVVVTSWSGYGNMLAGLAVGIAFLSTILTRNHAGVIADRRGGHICMQRGLIIYIIASLLCFFAALPSLSAPAAFSVLIAGRLLLGLGESLTIVGMLGWGIGLMGQPRAGKVLALTGMAMYGAFAAGAPIGLALFHTAGFAGVMLAAAAMPALGLALAQSVPAAPVHNGQRVSFWRIIGSIWQPGAAVGLQGVGFAGLGAFMALYFTHRHWPHPELGLTCFGLAFVLVRILCGHLPDRVGGYPVAAGSLIVETIGQVLLWTAPTPWLALLGAVLTGAGCSMVFPSLGVEVVHIVPPHLRGTALGGFAAFQDLAYGATGPVVGSVADYFGYGSIFFTGALCAAVGALITIRLDFEKRRRETLPMTARKEMR
ncbi:arabinose transporter [Acetobacter oeni]|uniref:Uncharacterized MFS-type transporter AOE01nite_08300 n=1 Tax=Acetobacter oeni TaxID=304077 RepID=A0A511XI31_9PROT|nr:arabinose transporter [Acetobacter oeni]MBB3883022.1 MFS family permease [Acetobacter oeni]NHO19098.1 MFS transporter [Acetobacter oeni]GBR11633.1 major facilitator superfamily transporter [Acetobacter oeni LMG 21952]GEN62606.1 arabinose transporter [Acetobacter oeni]